MVQENESAVSMLPSFLEVAGRKLDNVDQLMDRVDMFKYCLIA